MGNQMIYKYGPSSEQTLRPLRFCSRKRIIIRVVSLREQLFQTVRRLAGNILNGAALTDVGSVVRMALRGINIQIPDELVADDKSLGFVFARPLRFVHIRCCSSCMILAMVSSPLPSKYSLKISLTTDAASGSMIQRFLSCGSFTYPYGG